MSSPTFKRIRLYLLERLKLGELQRTLLIAVLIGFCGALATIAFRELVVLLEQLLFARNDGLVRIAMGLAWWKRVLYPTVGGVCAGLLLHWAGRRPKAGARNDYMEAIVLGDGQIGAHSSVLRALSSAVSVATGASLGREGSMVQLSALVGSLIGRLRAAGRPRQRLLVACGAAAGITAAYNAPLAGAFFVAEIVLQSFAIETLGPLIVAAVVADLTVHRFLGFGPIYHIPQFHLHLGVEAGAFALLGIAAGLLSPVFIALLEAAKKIFGKLPSALWLRLGLGGLVVGLISIANPAVWGNGYSVVDGVLQGDWAWQALLAILLFKVCATAASTGSGAVGGVFTPSLFVGAVIGALFSAAVHAVWPAASAVPAYVATGMGAFLAACTHAPLMSAVMIFEMTENYDVIAPLMLACVLAFFVKRVLMDRSIYEYGRPARQTDAFAAQTAADILHDDPPTVRDTQSAAEVEQVFLKSRWQHVYVIDHEGHFAGAISLHDFGPFLRRQGNANASFPSSLIKRDYPRVDDTATLGKVLEAFAGHSGERIPVVTQAKLLRGFVSKTDLLLVLQESVTASHDH